MTDQEFFEEYMAREIAGNKTERGADALAILHALCAEVGFAKDVGREIILDRTGVGFG